jgi:RNA polymerase sigma-70 factor (ECF subfamily)
VTDFPETRDSLIVQLRAPVNRAAWERFVELYRPVIFRLARGRGLQEADAQDLAQKVLLAVATAVGDGDRSNEIVHFRRWLRRVAHNAIINALSRRPIDLAAGGTTVQEMLREHHGADADSDAAIELEYRRELYRRASRIVQRDVEPETWRAFEMTVLEDRSIEEVEALLKKPAGNIYAARSRVMRRLREAVRELEEEDES